MEQSEIYDLVAKAKAGDQEAFTDLYNEAYKMVYLTCLGHMKNPEEAEDATQETFITVFNKLDSLEDNNTFFGWTKTIAVRACLRKLRSTRNNISFDDAIESGVNIEGDDNLEDLPDSMIMEETKRNVILDIIKKQLKEVQYQTIFMFYYDNMPVEKIAEIMECPVGTVKTRLKAARVKIKEGIEDYEKKTGDKLCAAGMFPALGAIFKTSMESVPVVVKPWALGTKSVVTPKDGAVKKVPASQKSVPTEKKVLLGEKKVPTAKQVPPKVKDVPAASSSTTGSATTSSATTNNATTGSTSTAVATSSNIATRIVAGVAATAILAGGTFGVVSYLNRETPLNELEIGDTFHYGSYNEDSISWLVLAQEGDRSLVISEHAIDLMEYNHSYVGDITWEESELRYWLNNEFYYSAFTPEEQERIIESYVYNYGNGNDTLDRIYILSEEEAREYFRNNEDRVCTYGSGFNAQSERWWLRTPMEHAFANIVVHNNGEITNATTASYFMLCAVRPVMWIDTSVVGDVVSDISNDISVTDDVINDYSEFDYGNNAIFALDYYTWDGFEGWDLYFERYYGYGFSSGIYSDYYNDNSIYTNGYHGEGMCGEEYIEIENPALVEEYLNFENSLRNIIIDVVNSRSYLNHRADDVLPYYEMDVTDLLPDEITYYEFGQLVTIHVEEAVLFVRGSYMTGIDESYHAGLIISNYDNHNYSSS